MHVRAPGLHEAVPLHLMCGGIANQSQILVEGPEHSRTRVEADANFGIVCQLRKQFCSLRKIRLHYHPGLTGYDGDADDGDNDDDMC